MFRADAAPPDASGAAKKPLGQEATRRANTGEWVCGCEEIVCVPVCRPSSLLSRVLNPKPATSVAADACA